MNHRDTPYIVITSQCRGKWLNDQIKEKRGQRTTLSKIISAFNLFKCEKNTLLSLPGKVYARVLERRIRPIVEPRIQEEQCGFRPGRGTLDHLYTLTRLLEGSWEFAQPVHMCFVDLEKAFDCVPRGNLWGVL
ncbi:uncharacterized protein LOC114443009 [Tachysurus ichikawai]